ncbi:hypothetical protein Vadar_007949 [Vaccinium darrowii]|uniref:Uncharacterized protein n=1 Tax=Vaccinium darrowii TaxID=229202 RepID=A0ACB7WZ05_9ERIC|nr:hypothetical protein Vadar_007949 [Vaccinium darrowii]
MTTGSSWRDQISWTTRLVLATQGLVTDAARRSNLIRRLLLLLEPKSPPSSTNCVTSSDVTIDPSRNLWFRLYLPSPTSSSSTLPLIFYFHGGGFIAFAPNSIPYDNLCRTLARDLQAVVVSVNDRLAPEHRYPSQYEDGLDALKFIDGQSYAVLPSSTDLNKCFIAGDSAGGNIAHHVTVRSSDHVFEKIKIIGLVAIQPFFGGELRTESELRLDGVAPVLNTKRTDWFWRSFLPVGSSRDHEAANVSGEEVTAVRFPSTLVLVGGYDPLQDWQRRYCEGLKKSGKEVELVELPNAIHWFYTFPKLPDFRYAIAKLKEFIEKQSAATI